MTDYTNEFERRARTRKVRRLCSTIREAAEVCGWDNDQQIAEAAFRFTDDEWNTIAKAAEVHVPSDATRIRVVEALKHYRRAS